MQQSTHSLGERTPIAVRLQLAQDEKTDAATLDFLSQDKRWQVRAAVALHPTTAPDTLKKLSVDEIPQVLAAVASNINCPQDVIPVFLQHTNPLVLSGLLHNVRLPANCATQLMHDNKVPLAIRQRAAQHPNVPINDAFYAAEFYPKQFLANPSFSLWLVEQPNFLATLESNAKANIARLTESEELQRALFACGDAYTWKALIKNPHSTDGLRRDIFQKLLRQLQKNEDDEFGESLYSLESPLKSLALDANTPIDLLHFMIDPGIDDGLIQIANGQTPQGEHELPSSATIFDLAMGLSNAALANQQLDAAFLEKIFLIEKKARLQQNHQLEDGTATKQDEKSTTEQNDDDEDIGEYDLGVLATHPHFPEHLRQEAFDLATVYEKQAICRSPLTSISLLASAVHDPDLCGDVMRNSSATPEILTTGWELFASRSLLWNIAGNDNTPVPILLDAIQRFTLEDEYARYQIASAKNMPIPVLRLLIESTSEKWYKRYMQKSLDRALLAEKTRESTQSTGLSFDTNLQKLIDEVCGLLEKVILDQKIKDAEKDAANKAKKEAKKAAQQTVSPNQVENSDEDEDAEDDDDITF